MYYRRVALVICTLIISVTPPSVTVYLGDVFLGDGLGGGDLVRDGVMVPLLNTTGNCRMP